MSVAQAAPVLATPQSLAVVKRYSNGYFSARLIVGFGAAIKVVGIVLAILVAIETYAVGERGLAITELVAAVIGVAVVVGALFFFLGILVSAQGEILRATLDSAVNSSPFLSSNQRAGIMSLPAIIETTAIQ